MRAPARPPCRPLLALLALAAAVALGAPGPAAAHADLRAAEPEPGAILDRAPGTVRLVLGAPVEPAFLRVEVTGPAGRPASGLPARTPADPRAVEAQVLDAGPGRYSVEWRALSEDGHVTGGVHAFAVGAGSAEPPAGAGEPVRGGLSPLTVAARLLALLGPVALLGLAVLRFGVVEPARRSGGIAPPGEPAAARAAAAERAGAALEDASPRWWAAWWAGVGAGAAGLVLLPAAMLRALREGPGELGTLLGDTRFGTAWWVQAGALLAASVAGASLRRRGGAWADAPPWAPALGLAAPPAVALVAIAWAGHASTGPDRLANIAIDALHGLATAAWLGGLAGLLALLPAAARRLADPERVRVSAGVVVRFSSLAIAAVSVLVVTGVYRALAELTSLADLTGTAYGRALLVKLALFAVLLAGGAYNRLVVHPRLERAALGLAGTDRGAGAALRVSVASELVLALAVMTSVAVLVSLAPPAG